MASFDGTGALEARIEAARAKRLDQEGAAAAQEAAKTAAHLAEVAAHDAESSTLVKDFIDRASRLGIKPTHRLLKSVQYNQSSRNETGPWYPVSKRVLDRTRIDCWLLQSGTGSYYLSSTGMNVVESRLDGDARFAFFKAEYRRHQIVTWTLRKPHIFDVVGRAFPYEGSSYEVSLVDAMVQFFQAHESKD